MRNLLCFRMIQMGKRLISCRVQCIRLRGKRHRRDNREIRGGGLLILRLELSSRRGKEMRIRTILRRQECVYLLIIFVFFVGLFFIVYFYIDYYIFTYSIHFYREFEEKSYVVFHLQEVWTFVL